MQHICVCGCFLEEHLEGGLCLHTLDCLCHGYEELDAWLERLVEDALTQEQIDTMLAWIREEIEP